MIPHDEAPEQTAAAGEAPTPGMGLGGGRYRVLYRVEEPYESTGHTDLIRTLYAAFEEAGLPVETSGVKHPRPKVAFGPPLPTCCTSDGEYFDLDLKRGLDDLVERLNSVLPPGLRVVRTERIDTKTAPLSSVIEAAEYCFFIPTEVMSSESLDGRLAWFAGERLWQVQRVSSKGTEKTIDLKRAVVRWSYAAAEGGSIARITAKLNDQEGHNANPALILSGLFRLPEEQAALVRVRRVEFYDANGQPLSRANWRRKRSRSLHTKSFEYLRYLDR